MKGGFAFEANEVTLTTTHDGVEIKVLSEAEAWQLVDDAAKHELGLSAREFIRRWEAGEYDDNPDRPEVMDIVMLLALLPHR